MRVETQPQTAVRPPGQRVEVRGTDAAAARAAATYIAREIRLASENAPRVTVAFSGGRTPEVMLRQLALHDVPWSRVHAFQVDERVVAIDDPRRNAHQLRNTIGRLLGDRLHLIAAVAGDDPSEVARLASLTMHAVLGENGAFDIVHLGLGDDGHTASLVPGDDSLTVADRAYAPTGLYQGTRRVTLTYPVLRRAALVCWLATGASKAPMATRLLAQDPSIPAGLLAAVPGVLFTDGAGAPL